MNNTVSPRTFVALGLGLWLTSPAAAQGLHAVRPLPGYSCMSLNLTEDQVRDFSALPPVMQQPSPTAPKLGVAGAIVMTVNPARVANGYIAVLMPDGRSGWVQVDKLRPYRNPTNPAVRCVPSMMANGRPGFAFPQ
jgi:hypothetical protein